MPLRTGPLMGSVKLCTARSPTAPETGCKEFTSASNEYDGLDEVTAVPFGITTKVAEVLNNPNRVESIAAAA